MTAEKKPLSDGSASVPGVDYFGKATDLIVSHDKLFVTLYTSLIAGDALLLFRQDVTVWVGAFLFLALVFFTFGVAHSLLHITFSARMLLAMERLIGGTDHVPNAIDGEESTGKAYVRMQAYAQRAYTGQLYYLLLGVLACGAGVVAHLWRYAWRSGVVVTVALAMLCGLAIAVRIWRRTILEYSRSRKTG